MRHARGWRCPCLECTIERVVDRLAIVTVTFAVLYFGGHVVVALWPA